MKKKKKKSTEINACTWKIRNGDENKVNYQSMGYVVYNRHIFFI